MVREVLAPYSWDDTDHLVHNAYTAHTAAHLHYLMQNHEQEVREVFTWTLWETRPRRNRCVQYILQKTVPPSYGRNSRV